MELLRLVVSFSHMSAHGLASALERLHSLEESDLTVGALCEQILQAFHDVIVFDAAALLTVDPETMLPAGGHVEGFETRYCAPFWETELTDPDFIKFSQLARSYDPVATLFDAVDGELTRSPRYQKLYSYLDAADELRAVFVAGTSCIAVGAFLRPGGMEPFTAQEAASVRALVPVATGVLRRALGRVTAGGINGPPVVIMLDDKCGILGMTPGAEKILDDLRIQQDGPDLPGIIQVAAAKARNSRTSTNLTTRVRSRSGQWLRVHVAPMDGKVGEVGVTVLTVENAQPDDLVPVLLESYGLTERETEVVLLLCRGLSMKEIAQELFISPHTVRDHVKAIHEKAGVSSRGELVAKLFCNHVLDRFHSAISQD